MLIDILIILGLIALGYILSVTASLIPGIGGLFTFSLFPFYYSLFTSIFYIIDRSRSYPQGSATLARAFDNALPYTIILIFLLSQDLSPVIKRSIKVKYERLWKFINDFGFFIITVIMLMIAGVLYNTYPPMGISKYYNIILSSLLADKYDKILAILTMICSIPVIILLLALPATLIVILRRNKITK